MQTTKRILDLTPNTYLSFPPDIRVFRREDQFLFLSVTNLVSVNVNTAGKVVLDACAGGNIVMEIARRCSLASGISVPQTLTSILPFLEQLVNADFLRVGNTAWDPQVTRESFEPAFHPVMLYLHLTNRCNMRCTYCYNLTYRSTAVEGGVPELSSAEMRHILDQAASLGVKQVIFTGGEPLMGRNAFSLAQHARSLGLSTALLTNGTLITDKNAVKATDLFNTVIVSLDSWIKEEHEAQRGHYTFDRTVNGIKALVRAGHPRIIIRPVITKRNLASLPHFPEFAIRELGCASFAPVPYLPNSLDEAIELDLFPHFDDYRAAMRAFDAALTQVSGSKPLECDPLRVMVRCGAGSDIISVSPTGDVFPCQALHFPELCGGNLREQSLEDIGTNSPVLKSLREVSIFDIPECTGCDVAMICGGACRAIAYSLYHDLKAHNAFLCPLLHEHALDRLWYESKQAASERNLSTWEPG